MHSLSIERIPRAAITAGVLSALVIVGGSSLQSAHGQFDAFAWTTKAPAGAGSQVIVQGDELRIELNVNCGFSLDHLGWARMLVREPGRFTFDVDATAAGCPFDLPYCAFMYIAVSVSPFPCLNSPGADCVEEYEYFNGGAQITGTSSPIQVTWSVDARVDDLLQIWVNDHGFSLDCKYLASFRGLVFTPALAADTETISTLVGGTVDFAITAPKALAGDWYALLGSASGTQPGTLLGSEVLPLVWDPYTHLSLQGAGGLLSGGIGLLGPEGEASAALTVPSGLVGLFGATLHHAYVVLDATTLEAKYTSQAVPLHFAL